MLSSTGCVPVEQGGTTANSSQANLEELIRKADQRKSLTKEDVQLQTLLKRSHKPRKLIGESPAMHEVYRLISRAGPSEKAIPIQGESGTGKELGLTQRGEPTFDDWGNEDYAADITSRMLHDGTFPTGTAKFERRSIGIVQSVFGTGH